MGTMTFDFPVALYPFSGEGVNNRQNNARENASEV